MTSIHEKYAARPKGVEGLTFSQFCTSYTKCSKMPIKIIFNPLDETDARATINVQLTEESLALYIKLSTNEV